MNIEELAIMLCYPHDNLVEIAVLRHGEDAVSFEDGAGNLYIMYRRNDKGEVGIVRVESREEPL